MADTILITGCSSGFGRLAAKTFHARGWNVVATMRSPEREEEFRDGQAMLVVELDVTDPESVRAAFSAARERFGAIDAVVNNAGSGGNGLFEQFSDADVRALFDVNVFGLMTVMREALPEMRRAGSGTIVNVTSMAGHVPVPGSAVYAAAKFAAVGITEAVALECRPLGVRVVEVAPGAYPSTRFTGSSDRRLEIGDDQLVRYAKCQSDRLQSTAGEMSEEGGSAADPQEVVDKILSCIEAEDPPINNPSGTDAEMMAGMIGLPERQAFLDQVAAWGLPARGEWDPGLPRGVGMASRLSALVAALILAAAGVLFGWGALGMLEYTLGYAPVMRLQNPHFPPGTPAHPLDPDPRHRWHLSCRLRCPLESHSLRDGGSLRHADHALRHRDLRLHDPRRPLRRLPA